MKNPDYDTISSYSVFIVSTVTITQFCVMIFWLQSKRVWEKQHALKNRQENVNGIIYVLVYIMISQQNLNVLMYPVWRLRNEPEWVKQK